MCYGYPSTMRVTAAQAGSLHAPPLDEHALDIAESLDEAGGLVLGAARRAPGADVIGRR